MTKEEVIAALERCACGKECVNCIGGKERQGERMNIPKKPYNVWLEKTIRQLYEEDVECVGITFRRKGGSSVVAYYNSTPEDKVRMAYHYVTDAMMDIVLANADLIKKAVEEHEEENGTEI